LTINFQQININPPIGKFTLKLIKKRGKMKKYAIALALTVLASSSCIARQFHEPSCGFSTVSGEPRSVMGRTILDASGYEPRFLAKDSGGKLRAFSTDKLGTVTLDYSEGGHVSSIQIPASNRRIRLIRDESGKILRIDHEFGEIGKVVKQVHIQPYSKSNPQKYDLTEQATNGEWQLFMDSMGERYSPYAWILNWDALDILSRTPGERQKCIDECKGRCEFWFDMEMVGCVGLGVLSIWGTPAASVAVGAICAAGVTGYKYKCIGECHMKCT
jgi:hypothetical protein